MARKLRTIDYESLVQAITAGSTMSNSAEVLRGLGADLQVSISSPAVCKIIDGFGVKIGQDEWVNLTQKTDAALKRQSGRITINKSEKAIIATFTKEIEHTRMNTNIIRAVVNLALARSAFAMLQSTGPDKANLSPPRQLGG